jgi:hypothetical protein
MYLLRPAELKVVMSTKNVQTGMIDLFEGASWRFCTFGLCRSLSGRAYIVRAIT